MNITWNGITIKARTEEEMAEIIERIKATIDR